MPTPKLAPVIAVLNLKGGVGKTTVTAHVMRVLYHDLALRTLLIDLDPQFNLTQAVLARSTYDKFKLEGRTIFAAMEPAAHTSLFEIDTASTIPAKPSDLTHKLRYIADPGKDSSLNLIPGDFRLVKYSLIRDHDKLDVVQKRFLRFVADARREYGLVCIDCNPSSSFITSCALHACTHILVPVRPDRYSLLGLELLADLLDQLPTIHPKPEIIVLLNAVRATHHDRQIETELRSHGTFGTAVLVSKLRDSALLAAKSTYTGFATDRGTSGTGRLKREIRALVAELAKALGLK